MFKAGGFAALVAAIAALAAAPAAHATTVLGGGNGPDVAVGADGSAHITWLSVSPDRKSATVRYCQIPAGRDDCSISKMLALPYGDGADARFPRIFVRGARILLVTGTRTNVPDGVDDEDRTVLWESLDGGATFSPPATVGNLRPADAVLTRDGTRVITVDRHETGEYVRLQSTPSSPGHPPAEDAALLPARTYLPEHLTIGLAGAAPVAVWNTFFTRHIGGQVDLTESWSDPASHGGPGVEADLAGGIAGLYLAETASPGLHLRHYAESWGPPADPTCGDQRNRGGGGLGSPSLAQAANGRLHLVYRADVDGSPDHLRYVTSADGRTFSAPVTVDADGGHENAVVAGEGSVAFAVWARGAGDATTVFAERLPVDMPACQPPAPAAPSAPPAPTAPPAAAPRTPVLTGLGVTPRSFRLRTGSPALRFTLDREATVLVKVQRLRARRWVKVRSFRVRGRAGANRVRLTTDQLRGSPGRYRLVVAPRADGLTGASSAVGYRIKRRRP